MNLGSQPIHAMPEFAALATLKRDNAVQWDRRWLERRRQGLCRDWRWHPLRLKVALAHRWLRGLRAGGGRRRIIPWRLGGRTDRWSGNSRRWGWARARCGRCRRRPTRGTGRRRAASCRRRRRTAGRANKHRHRAAKTQQTSDRTATRIDQLVVTDLRSARRGRIAAHGCRPTMSPADLGCWAVGCFQRASTSPGQSDGDSKHHDRTHGWPLSK
jgi:hypothetical protein